MSFYEDWTDFIKCDKIMIIVVDVYCSIYRAPTKYTAPSTLDITSLLCVHGGFLYDPCVVTTGDSKE